MREEMEQKRPSFSLVGQDRNIFHLQNLRKKFLLRKSFAFHRRNRVALFGFFYLMITKGELNSFLNLSRSFLC